jgi:hypothetical protein
MSSTHTTTEKTMNATVTAVEARNEFLANESKADQIAALMRRVRPSLVAAKLNPEGQASLIGMSLADMKADPIKALTLIAEHFGV